VKNVDTTVKMRVTMRWGEKLLHIGFFWGQGIGATITRELKRHFSILVVYVLRQMRQVLYTTL
jgi:hypothetical protein